MKKKDYRKPTMKVVKLRQRHHLLTGSQVESVGTQNYGWHEETEE